ncbi:MAG: histone deacetylase, partial [Planctomycetota bacterium]
ASAGGTLAAAEHAQRHGFAGVLAGGTHHAYVDFGSGYCVFNDLAIAARRILSRRWARRVLVVDLDVHQGDGTAAIFKDDPRVFTLSLHGARNFPARKQESDLDVALPDDTGDTAYGLALGDALDAAVAASRPEFLLYQAGVDALAEDRLGRLALTLDGLRERDERVFDLARALGVPIVTTLGGGYADPLEPTLAAHEQTYRVAVKRFGTDSALDPTPRTAGP